MNIYSKRLGRDVELRTEKYGELELISHQSLVDVFSELKGIDISYSVITSDIHHSVILGIITDPEGVKVTEIGEALDTSLANDIARMYPTTMAFTRAFDRAVVKYLMLPGKNYSNTEILTSSHSAPEALQTVLDETSDTNAGNYPHERENPSDAVQEAEDYQSLPLKDLGSIIITIGKYADRPSSVEQIAHNKNEVSWTDFIIDKFATAAGHPFQHQAEALKTYIERGGRKK